MTRRMERDHDAKALRQQVGRDWRRLPGFGAQSDRKQAVIAVRLPLQKTIFYLY